jgi:hypothetical protein
MRARLARHSARLDAFGGSRQWIWIVGLLMVVWFCPNSRELIAKMRQPLATLRQQWA